MPSWENGALGLTLGTKENHNEAERGNKRCIMLRNNVKICVPDVLAIEEIIKKVGRSMTPFCINIRVTIKTWKNDFYALHQLL